MEKHIVRTFFRLALFITATTILAANIQAATVSLLDLKEWDANILSSDGGSQHFENVAGELDVTVTAVGDFDAPSRFVSTLDGGDDAISTQHDPSTEQQCHSYVFTFSDATDLIVETWSLDAQEEYMISSAGNVSYTNLSGSEPITNEISPNMLHLDGVAFGRDTLTGSSDGATYVTAPESGPFSLTVKYCADPTAGATNLTKYGSFRVSAVSAAVTQLPEPGAMSLFGLGGCVLLLSRRKRRS